MNPVLFQGPRRKPPYFEGWYFKQVTADERRARSFAVIPGVSVSSEGRSAFIQTLRGPEGVSSWVPFPYDEFSFSDQPFEVRIGPNRFSLDGAVLDLAAEGGRIRAELRYSGRTAPRSRLFSPGVMGPYAFAPFMECRHGVASLHHEVDGWVDFGGDRLAFSGGRGYIEKDWGRSMPSSWIWMQSNSFPEAVGPTSFFFSLARVPWLGSSFNGFIGILWTGGREYRFASYTGARVELLETRAGSVRILLSDREHKLEIQQRDREKHDRSKGGALAAPVEGAMRRSIRERPDSHLRLILKRRHGSAEDIILDASTTTAATEIAGDASRLAP